VIIFDHLKADNNCVQLNQSDPRLIPRRHSNIMPSLFTTFIILAQCVSAGLLTRDSHESPFGITFSPSAVYASRFNSSGVIEVEQYPFSSEYQAYYANAVKSHATRKEKRSLDYRESASHLNAVSMFREITSPITASLKKRLGHDPTYATLFIPSIFDDEARDAAVEAVLSANHLETATKFGTTQVAAGHAYDFLGCKHHNRAPEKCNIDGPVSLVLLLEYEKNYLYAFIKEVAFWLGTLPEAGREICVECGERYRDVSGTVPLVLVQSADTGLGEWIRRSCEWVARRVC
jgi:hypothetical protein